MCKISKSFPIAAINTLECYKCQSDRDPGCAFATLASIQQWDYEICAESVTECAVWLSNV